MTAAEYLLAHPEIPHGTIRLGFTPDEEIGRGVDFFDVQKFGAQFAYTVDGSAEGELEFENFNAASARIVIQGRNIHPGYAKGRMINALQVAWDFHARLPETDRPERTEGYEGFFHLTAVDGTVERAEAEYIVRDHSRERFEERKALMQSIADRLNKQYGAGTVTLVLTDQYYNMKEKIAPYPEVVEKAKQAMSAAGVTPVLRPIRGGTDGARLSWMGLPCPNLFTGGMNFHGRFEYCSLQVMEKAVLTLVNLARLWGED
jgi:tripeptide aminopeptidase